MNSRYILPFLRLLKIPGLYPVMKDRQASLRVHFIFATGIFLTASALVLISFEPAFSAVISRENAEKVGHNLITYLGGNHTIEQTETLEQRNGKIGYLMHLSPRGYILVPADSIRVPVKAYSLHTGFEQLPPAYTRTLLKEIQLPDAVSPGTISSRSTGKTSPEETNRPYWDFLTSDTIISKKSLRNYTPDTFLLTSTWDQDFPYNKLNPESGNTRTLTGCVQTAVAQVMRYHAHPDAGSGVFTHTWNGETLKAVMNRPFNWEVMPDTVNGSVEQYRQEEVAALMRDLGILNQADFGTDATSAPFHKDAFKRAFGYAPVSQMKSTDNDFFTTIVNEINNQRPVLLALPDHMTVADGYASDGSGKKIHVNLGWGGAYDDYYYLDRTIMAGEHSFAPDHTIYYNIRPCRGEECTPYIPASSGNSPVIDSALNDMIVGGTDIMRIEAQDPDGDTVTLSASSSCAGILPSLNGNLLSLNPVTRNIFCEITITAQSHDGIAEKNFKLLVLEDRIYMGTKFHIGGEFANGTEIDQYNAYLEGNVTIAGYRGYANQAFYIWVKDNGGNVVIPASNTQISENLTGGLYTISTSLENSFTNYYYPYDADYRGYNLTVTCDDLTGTVSDIAADMGIVLSNDDTPPETLTDYRILTQNAAPLTIRYGEYVQVFGTPGTDTVHVESGARVQCMNFKGGNVLDIEDATSDFTVHRSGATIYLESPANGTWIIIAANPVPQTLNFSDVSLSLFISDGKVNIGTQEILQTTTQVDAYSSAQ